MTERQFIKRRWIWTIILILYIGFIFHNSLTPALESSRQSGSVLAMVLKAAEAVGIKSGWITEHLIRKTAHYAEYGLLGIFLGITLRYYSFALAMRRMVQCWLGIMIPFVDETIQLFVEGRSGQISDVWLDMAGVFSGYVFIGILLTWRREKRG